MSIPGIELELKGLIDVPAGMGIWARFSPVSMITEDLLGGKWALGYGRVLGH